MKNKTPTLRYIVCYCITAMLGAAIAGCSNLPGLFVSTPTPTGQPVRIQTAVPSATTLPCTPLSTNMTLQVVPIGSDAVRIEMTGMQPGETPAVIVDASSPNATLHAENRTTHPVDSSGQFIWEVAGLRFDSPGSLPPSHFNIQVIHAQGTACTSIQLP